MINQAKVFNALGDQTRLKIISRLSAEKYFTITQVSIGLNITRQGVRRHLQVLKDAQLVNFKPSGRDVLVTMNPAALNQAKQFILMLEQKWDNRLEALKNFVEDKK